MTTLNNENIDTFVIFNTITGKRYGSTGWGGYKQWNTASSAKGALTRLKKQYLKTFEDDLEHTFTYITSCYESGKYTEETHGVNQYATQEGRDAHREEMKEYKSDWKVYQGLCDSEVVTYDYFYENEPVVERTNISGGNKYTERLNTPSFLSPSCDSYYR